MSEGSDWTEKAHSPMNDSGAPGARCFSIPTGLSCHISRSENGHDRIENVIMIKI